MGLISMACVSQELTETIDGLWIERTNLQGRAISLLCLVVEVMVSQQRGAWAAAIFEYVRLTKESVEVSGSASNCWAALFQ